MRFGSIRLAFLLSIMNLTAITVDRYIAITNPFRYRAQNQGTVVKVILAVWLVGIVVIVTFYLLFTTFKKDGKWYMNLLFPITTGIALMVFFYCNISIYITVRTHGRTMKISEVSFNAVPEISSEDGRLAVIYQTPEPRIQRWNRAQKAKKVTRKCSLYLRRKKRESNLLKLALRKSFCL